MSVCHFIVNPLAGSGRTATQFAIVEKKLAELGVDYRVSYTQRAHHGTELALDALEAGASCVVAAGGDGTVNEVASAMCGKDAAMGVLPFGTGNDFARAALLPTEPLEALSVILEGHTRRMDVGCANGLTFANVAGIGFDVDVLRATEKYKVKYNGMLPYMLGIFEAMTHLRTLHTTIEVNGEELHEDALLIAVGNGQYFGGGMRAIPTGDLFDGLLDVRVIQRVSLPKLLCLLPKFVKGKLSDDCPYLKAFRTDALKVSCPEECTLELDGELVSGTPAELRLLPGAIRLLVRKGKDD